MTGDLGARRARPSKVVLKTIATLALVALFATFTAIHAVASDTTSIIVRLAPGLSESQQHDVIARDGGTETSAIGALRLHVVDVNSSDLDATLAAYRNDANVQSAELDATRAAEATPSDPSYASQWSLPQIGWDSSSAVTGSATIAVLDTGVDASQEDLGSRVLSGHSSIGGTATSDPNGHGTWLATIAAAQTDNGVGIAGVDYASPSVLPVQVLGADGTGRDSDIIDGTVWAADHGADVILMAFSNPGYSQSLQDAIDYAWSKGAVVVAATGNDSSTATTYPAGDAKVVGVAATDENDALWSGSNSGADTFIAAPGTNILAGSPGGGTTSISGTSTSAAIVAGAAALLHASDPSASNGTIVGRLARNTDPAGTADQTGNGRLNLARALADTSTADVTPAGAGSNGGPLVGPYTAAAFSISASFNSSTSSITATTTGTDPTNNKYYKWSFYRPGATPGTSTPDYVSPCFAWTDAGASSYTVALSPVIAGTWQVTDDRYNGDCTSVTSHKEATANVATASVSVSITGATINDQDGDGAVGATETGFGGATITLYRDANANGTLETGTDTLVSSVTSNSAGGWDFTVSNTGTYFVTRANPTGWVSTNAIAGSGSSSTATKITNDQIKVVMSSASATSSSNNFLAQKRADLAITNTPSSTSVGVGAAISYTLGVTNNGPATADVTVTDTIGSATYGSASGTGWSCSQASGTVTCTRTAVPSGAVPSITVNVTAPTSPGSVSNTASVSVALPAVDTVAANNSQTAVTTVGAGAAANLAKDSGDGQSALVTTTLGSSLVVKVTDSYGNPISGVTVSFAVGTTPVGSSGAAVGAGSAVTGADGKASVSATLGDRAGTYTYTATSSGLSGSPATFSETATARPTTTSLSSGTNPSTYGSSVTFTATVTSTAGNPSGVGTVTFYDGATPICTSVALSGNQATCSTSALSATGSPHSITASYTGPASGPEYGPSTSSPLSQTVNKKPVTVTTANASKNYGTADPSPLTSADVSGFVASDNITASFSRAIGESVNTYPITTTLNDPGSKLGNYTVTNTGATFTINQVGSTTTVTVSNATYDGAAHGGTAAWASTGTDGGGASLTVMYSGRDGTTYGPSTTAPTAAGTYVAAASFAGDTNHTGSNDSKNFEIFKKDVTVATTDAGKTYGDVDPSPLTTADLSGFVASDNITATFSRASGESYGPYHITTTLNDPGSKLGNYTVTNNGATFTIGKAGSTTTVTVSNATYDGSAHGGSASWSSTGSDAEGAILTVSYSGRDGTTYGPTTTAPTAAGKYVASASFGGDANHTGSNDSKNFEIFKKNVTVTTSNASKSYGDSDPSPLTIADLSGFVASDNIGATFSRAIGESVNTYPITTTLTDPNSKLGNYTVTNTGATFTINQVGSTTTVTVTDATYDGAAHGASAAWASTGTDSEGSSLTVSYAGRDGTTYGPSTAAPTAAGKYTASASYAGDTNHTGSNDSKNFEIFKKTVTVTTSNASKNYGDADPTPLTSADLTVFVASDNISATFSRAPGESVNTYHITTTLTDPDSKLGNYTVTNTGATFTINQVGSTTTVTVTDATYDGNPHGGTAAWASTGADGEGASLTVSYSGRDGTTYGPSATAPTAAGKYIASASYAGDTNHTGSNDSKNFEIFKKSVTVTTSNASKNYGDTDPSPLTSADLSGFVSGDNIGATFSRAPGESVNTYHITTTLTDPNSKLGNYTVTNTGATFTINQVGSTTTVTVTDATYDGNAHGGTAAWASTGSDGEGASLTVSYSGRDGTTYGPTTTAPTAAGKYIASASYAGDTNHTTSNDSKNFEIFKKNVTVTTSNASKNYGDADPSPLTSADLSGFVASDNIGATFSRAIGESATTYPITTTLTDPDSKLGNYTVTNTGATFTINQVGSTTTVTVTDATYDGNPHGGTAAWASNGADGEGASLTVSYAGRDGTTYGPSTTAPTAAGKYVASASYAGDVNHTGSNDSKNFEIFKKNVTVTTSNASKNYGDTDPTPLTSADLTVFVASDNISATFSRAPGESVNTYHITTTLTDPDSKLSNYTVTNTGATFTINQVGSTTTVTASNATYDGATHGATASWTSTGTDGEGASLTVTYSGRGTTSYGPSTTAPTNAGTYVAAASFAGDVNHTGSNDSKNFEIFRKAATVVADAKSKIYGAANPALTAVVTGTVGSDTINYTLSTTATTSSIVGGYPITVTLGSNPNYDVTTTDNTLTVNPANTSVTAANTTSTYSEQSVNVTLNATVTNTSTAAAVNEGTVTFQLKNGATNVGSAVTSGTVSAGAASVTYAIPAGTNAGPYTISVTYNPGSNFNGSTDATKTLTINKHATSTAASPATGTYGSPITLSAIVSASGAPSSTVNAGTVTFQVKQGATNIGAPATSGTVSNGAASVTFSLPSSATAGSYSYVATYNPSSNFLGSSDTTGTLTLNPREANAAYIGQTLFVTSGTNSTTAQVTLSASLADPDGTGSVMNGTATFTDLLTGKVLASGVKIAPVSNSDTRTGTANVVVTLSSGQYGAQEYLIEVSIGGSYKNCQQTGQVTYNGVTYCAGLGVVSPTSPAYKSAHATVDVMIPPTQYSLQGTGSPATLTTAAGTYGDASAVHYAMGLQYNSKGTNLQGQIQLVLTRADGTYYVKSNSISSAAFSNGTPAKDVTIYTKASIYRVNPNGTLTSIDGGVSFRIDAHEGCTMSPSCASSSGDTIGFTVLSSKTSALYYSNNWVYDSSTKAWRTMPQTMTAASAVVIN